jgi:hypothetical protein
VAWPRGCRGGGSGRTLPAAVAARPREAWAITGARAGQALIRLRPFRRRAARMARPALVRMRSRKPCVFARWRLFGWNVRLLTGTPGAATWSRQPPRDRARAACNPAGGLGNEGYAPRQPPVKTQRDAGRRRGRPADAESGAGASATAPTTPVPQRRQPRRGLGYQRLATAAPALRGPQPQPVTTSLPGLNTVSNSRCLANACRTPSLGCGKRARARGDPGPVARIFLVLVVKDRLVSTTATCTSCGKTC